MVWDKVQLEKLAGAQRKMPKIFETTEKYEFHAMGFDSPEKFTVMATLYDPKNANANAETVKIKIPHSIVSKNSIDAKNMEISVMNAERAVADYILSEASKIDKTIGNWKTWAAKNINTIIEKERALYSPMPFDGEVSHSGNFSTIALKLKKPSVIFLSIKK